MYGGECLETAKNSEKLMLAETTSEGSEYSAEELKLLTEKWSR